MKNRVKTISLIALSLLLLTAVGVAFKLYTIAGNFGQEIRYSYTRAMGDLSAHLMQLQITLEKGAFVTTPTGQAGVAAQLRESGGGAKAAMESLPFAQDKAEKIERSISVIADFGLYLSRKSAEGQTLSQEDYGTIATLGQHVSAIQEAFTKMRQGAADGDLSIGETKAFLSGGLDLPEPPAFDDSLSDVAKALSALPTMLYDGPFSDHIEQREPEFLKGKGTVTKEQAIEKAAQFLNVEPDSLQVAFETQDSLAAYEIRGDEQVVKITKVGGAVSFYKKTQDVAETKLSYEEALEKAQQILQQAGYANMKESYYVSHDNICTINFAATQEDVILYPDLVKVSIALNEGGMVEFSATGYLMNHKQRQDILPILTEEQASRSVSSNLQIQTIATAIIPTPGQGERLCYEFTCTAKDGQQIMVYINSSAGLEEQIFLVEKSDGGHLVQ